MNTVALSQNRHELNCANINEKKNQKTFANLIERHIHYLLDFQFLFSAALKIYEKAKNKLLRVKCIKSKIGSIENQLLTLIRSIKILQGWLQMCVMSINTHAIYLKVVRI